MTKDDDRQVHIVDDDEAIRSSLSMLFASVDMNVQTHEDGKSFLDFLSSKGTTSVGCIVLDIRMPIMSGADVYKELKARGIDLPVIFITGHGDIPMAVEAMHKGAFDFIPKPFRDQDLLDRVTAAINKSDSEAEMKAQLNDYSGRYGSLTDREKEVMSMIIAGKANKVVALDLELSQRTVEIHRSHVMEKMKAKSLAELVRISVALNIPLA